MECQFVPGWKGLVDLMNRSGQGSAWTGAVFEGDEFEYSSATRRSCKHVPGPRGRAERHHALLRDRPSKGADWPVIEVWPVAKVRKHRDRYNKVGDKHYSFENWEMYAARSCCCRC
jgi:recombination protein RecT